MEGGELAARAPQRLQGILRNAELDLDLGKVVRSDNHGARYGRSVDSMPFEAVHLPRVSAQRRRLLCLSGSDGGRVLALKLARGLEKRSKDKSLSEKEREERVSCRSFFSRSADGSQR